MRRTIIAHNSQCRVSRMDVTDDIMCVIDTIRYMWSWAPPLQLPISPPNPSPDEHRTTNRLVLDNAIRMWTNATRVWLDFCQISNATAGCRLHLSLFLSSWWHTVRNRIPSASRDDSEATWQSWEHKSRGVEFQVFVEFLQIGVALAANSTTH